MIFLYEEFLFLSLKALQGNIHHNVFIHFGMLAGEKVHKVQLLWNLAFSCVTRYHFILSSRQK